MTTSEHANASGGHGGGLPRPWKVLKEEVVYADRWVKVILARVRLPSGREYTYTTLWRVPGAAVVALNEQGHILLVQEYRHPLGEIIHQLPGGLVDEGETPLETAQRELREETGYEAACWERLGVVQDNPGLINGATTLFLAQRLKRVSAPRPEWTEFQAMDWYPLDWLRAQVRAGHITDRTVLAALAMLCARNEI